MNRTPSLVSILIAALVLAAVSIISCGQSSGTVDAASAKPEFEKTAERLLERSSARWKLVVAAQEDPSKWIDVYDYEMPEMKRRQTLAMFLESKHKFHYDSPTRPSVLLMEGDDAYVQVDCTWLAYMHPVIGQNSPGLQELMEMLEVWRWREGDWYMDGAPNERQKFLVDDPELAQRVDAYLSRDDADIVSKPDSSTKNDEPK